MGQVWQQVDAKNQTTQFTYDDLNRLTHRLEPDLDSNWIYDTAAQGVGKLAEAYTLRGDGTKDYRRVQSYDGLSRPSTTVITLDLDYTQTNSYDALGRLSDMAEVRNPIDGSGGPGVTFHYDYNGYGYLSQIQSRQGSASHLEWQANAQDAEQRVTREMLGDGRFTDRHFNLYTGTLDSLSAGVDNGSGGDDASLENETYLYDSINDLTYRAQRKPDGSLLQESFSYDALNRLVTSQVSGLTQKTYSYDAIGNLNAKSDVGSYSYPASGAGSVRPHAVANISGTVAGQGSSSFSYDANGNLTSGANRSMTWTSFDMPATITRTLASTSAASINVALTSNGASASASSTYPDNDFGAAGAINGDRTGAGWGSGAGWNSATYGHFPETLEVDFSGSKTISEIDVFSLQDNFQNPQAPTPSMTFSSYGLVDFDLESWNGSAWVPVPNGHVTGNNLVWKKVTFPALTTSKIHIIVHSASDGFSRVVELEAWTPGAIPASTNTASFVYGPEHQRIRQTVTGTSPITIYYAGAMEKEVTGSGTTVKTRMPRGIGYLSDTTGDTAVRYRYARGDHLGSSVMLTDDTGAVLDRDSYDAWGQRRNPDGSDDATYSLTGYDRNGYTGEEMLDTIGLVHLNGRVYDPLVGKFVSADPTIPDPNDSQSLNRYAYVTNNPLRMACTTAGRPHQINVIRR